MTMKELRNLADTIDQMDFTERTIQAELFVLLIQKHVITHDEFLGSMAEAEAVALAEHEANHRLVTDKSRVVHDFEAIRRYCRMRLALPEA
jgi:hypothetical protein